MKLVIGLLVAFGIGFGCKYFDLPAPAPPMLTGALLVVAMTLGYTAAGALTAKPAGTTPPPPPPSVMLAPPGRSGPA